MLSLGDKTQARGAMSDAGVESGDEVSFHNDPLVSKLPVHSEDRAVAFAPVERA